MPVSIYGDSSSDNYRAACDLKPVLQPLIGDGPNEARMVVGAFTPGCEVQDTDLLVLGVCTRHVKVPRSYQGPVCLDWEGCALLALTLDTETYAFQSTLQEFVKGLVEAKKMRPHAKFGYYALPMSSFIRDENWVHTQ